MSVTGVRRCFTVKLWMSLLRESCAVLHGELHSLSCYHAAGPDCLQNVQDNVLARTEFVRALREALGLETVLQFSLQFGRMCACGVASEIEFEDGRSVSVGEDLKLLTL